MATLRGKVVNSYLVNLAKKVVIQNACVCRFHTGMRRCGQGGSLRQVPPIVSHPRYTQSSSVVTKQEHVHTAQMLKTEEVTQDDPLQHEDYFQVKDLVEMEKLFEAGVHYGHKIGLRNPYMLPYLYGNRMGVDIIDLTKTMDYLKHALNVTAHIAYRGGVVLFIGRYLHLIPTIEKAALEAGEYSHCRYWRGGTLTNSTQLFGFETRLPDLCIFLSTLNNVFEQHRAVVEAAKMLIPTMGIVDTNADPCLITYPVPGNDDSLRCIELYCDLFKQAILKGKQKRKENGLEELSVEV